MGILINIQVLPPNQSLKLTEVAVDDFARAKQPVTIGQDLSRADWIPSLRHFVAAASSGPLGGLFTAFTQLVPLLLGNISTCQK